MAAVATVTKKYGIGGTATLYVGTIAFDSSYPTGGEAIDLSGNERVEYIQCNAQGGYVFVFEQNDQKLLAYYGDNNNAADGPLIEVPNTTDLSSLTAIPFIAVGS